MTEPDEPIEPTEGEPEDRTDWKAEARKWETRAKENAAAAKRLAGLEEAQKTAEQKAAEGRQQAERERDEARAELLRMKVAAAKGLPADLAARLRGSTEEELTKDADELLKLVKPAAQPSAARPVPDLKSGALPAGSNDQAGAIDMDARIRQRVRGGQ